MPTPDTVLGPNGAAVFNFHGQYRLKVGATISVPLELQQPGGTTDADISGFTRLSTRLSVEAERMSLCLST